MFKPPQKDRQKDLFNHFNSGKKSIPDEPKPPGEHRRSPLAIYPEHILTMLIVLFILCVLAFSMGVWRGKSIKNINKISKTISLDNAQRPSTTAVKTEVQVLQHDKGIAKDPKKPYTIQLVAYKNKDRAFEEVNHLKTRGYHSRIITRGGFYQVCVGQYKNLKEAKRDMKALRKRYKDCFLRRI